MHCFSGNPIFLRSKIIKEGCYCLQFGNGRFGGMNNYLEKWYEVRKELEESMPSMTDEEREKKIFDYNMFEWTYPNAIIVNTEKKYNEHPINRMYVSCCILL